MKASEKFERIGELQKKIKEINNKFHTKLIRDCGPLRREEQKLKDSIFDEKNGNAREIKSDVKKFVDEMRKKYGKLKDLDVTYHVLHFGSNVEIAVDFEIPLESLIKHKETLREKGKRLAKKRKGKK